jgi:hypothetical protein
MATKRTALILSVAVLLGASIVAWIILPHGRPNRVAEEGVATRRYKQACRLGEEHKYEIFYESSGSYDSHSFEGQVSKAFSGETRFQANIQGILHETCIKDSGKIWTFQLELFPRVLSVSKGDPGHGLPQQIKSPNLGGQIYLEKTAEGRIIRVWFPRNTDAMSRNLIRDIISQRAVVFPESGIGKESWHTREEDANGEFQAGYVPVEWSSDEVKIEKQRLGYLQSESTLRRTHDGLAKNIGADTKVTMRIDVGKGIAKSVNSRLALTLTSGSRPVATMQTDYRESFAGASPLDARSLGSANLRSNEARQEESRLGNLLGTDSDERIERMIQQQELGAETVDDIVEQLAAVENGSPQATKLFLKLKAAFLLGPQNVKRASDQLLQWDPAGAQFQITVGALVSAGTKTCQLALVDAMEALRKEPAALHVLIATSGYLKNPLTEVEHAARSFAQGADTLPSVRQTAWLAIGNYAHSLQQMGQMDRYKALEKSALELSQSAKNRLDRLDTAQVLGNMGSERGLPFIQAMLESGDVMERVVASSALRFVESPAAQAFLVKAISSDPSPDVRTSAIQSLSFRRYSRDLLTSLRKLLKTDPSDGVRIALLNTLVQDLEVHPELKHDLEIVVKTDVSSQVRQQAQSILNQLAAISP